MCGSANPDSRRDQDLIDAALGGDKDSFGTLVKRHWRMAVALALTQVEDPAQAEDIAQESFIRAYAHLHKLRDRSRFAGWLGRIVVQESIDHIRKRTREKLVPISQLPELESVRCRDN